MALRGNLKDFSLPDVFQLVAYSRKTGVLRIRRPDGTEGGVWFRDGDVFFARSDWHGELLGERLVAAQRITPAALERALAQQAAEPAGGRRLGRILVEEGYITEGVLEAFVQEQIQDTIFDLMRWDDGQFDFEVLPDSVEEDIGLAVSLENIVMEGSRRLEEWERIRRKIPSMDVVFKMATAPGEGSFEISLKPVEWSLLLLVDGTRSVEELARATSRTDFEVARIVYGLVSAGLLEFAEEFEVENLRAARSEREARQAALIAGEAESAQAEVEPTAEPPAEPGAELVVESVEEPIVEPLEEPIVEPLEEPAEGPVEEMPEQRAAELPQPEPEPAEEPEFLTGEQTASAHDLNVFEEMVAAVLEHPAPAPPEPEIERHVPEELPAAMIAPPEPEAAFGASEAADILGLEPILHQESPSVAESGELAPEAEASEATPETVVEEPTAQAAELDVEVVAESEPQVELAAGPEEMHEPEVAAGIAPTSVPQYAAEVELAAEPDLSADIEPASELEPEPTPQAGETPQPAAVEVKSGVEVELPEAEVSERDFERDLMSLGLGELPSDMHHEELEEVEEFIDEPEVYADSATETSPPNLSDLIVGSYPETGELPAQLPAQPETPSAPDEPEVESLATEVTSVEEPPVLGVLGGEPMDLVGEEADLESLLASLEAEPHTEAKATPTPMPEVEDVQVGFSMGLNDELSALTGADRPTRPSATVSQLPQPGTTLRRDGAIDKGTLLQIIDGIERL